MRSLLLFGVLTSLACGRFGYDGLSEETREQPDAGLEVDDDAGPAVLIADGFWLIESATFSDEAAPRKRAEGDMRGDVTIAGARIRARFLKLNEGLGVGAPVALSAELEIDGDVWLLAADDGAAAAFTAHVVDADRVELVHRAADQRNTTATPVATRLTLARSERVANPDPRDRWTMTELVVNLAITPTGVCVQTGNGGSAIYNGGFVIDDNFFLDYALAVFPYIGTGCSSASEREVDTLAGFLEVDGDQWLGWLGRNGTEEQIHVSGTIDEDGTGRTFVIATCLPDARCEALPNAFTAEPAAVEPAP